MSDLPRVGDAACGCGYFDTGYGLAKIHDGKCEFATKKKAEPKDEDEKPEPKVEPVERGTLASGESNTAFAKKVKKKAKKK